MSVERAERRAERVGAVELRAERLEFGARGHGVLARWLLGWALAGACGGLRAETAYEEIVAPIFQARCASCHGAEKQKGKLALHTWERSEKGGDSGPLWVAGKPGESELVRRLKLPGTDDEHMPPADEAQLTAEEIALLVRWIERGASAKAGVVELKLEPALAKAAAELRKKLEASEAGASHAEPLWELDSVAVEKSRAPLAAKVVELQRRFPGALTYESRTSKALTFTAAGLGREFGDDDLTALAAVGAEVVVLDISATAVTEKAAATLGRFPTLRVLRLASTEVGDGMAAAIGRLRSLEVVVLSNTAVSPTGLAAVGKLPGLRKLHIGGALAESAKAAKLPVVETAGEALTPVAGEAAAAGAPKS